VGPQASCTGGYARQPAGYQSAECSGSDQQGGRVLLAPLKGLFPRLKLIWGDSHYGGTFLVWVKEQLGWVVQTIHALTVPKRGLLVSEGEARGLGEALPPQALTAPVLAL